MRRELVLWGWLPLAQLESIGPRAWRLSGSAAVAVVVLRDLWSWLLHVASRDAIGWYTLTGLQVA